MLTLLDIGIKDSLQSSWSFCSPVARWVFSSFLLQSKEMHVRLVIDLKLTVAPDLRYRELWVVFKARIALQNLVYSHVSIDWIDQLFYDDIQFTNCNYNCKAKAVPIPSVSVTMAVPAWQSLIFLSRKEVAVLFFLCDWGVSGYCTSGKPSHY